MTCRKLQTVWCQRSGSIHSAVTGAACVRTRHGSALPHKARLVERACRLTGALGEADLPEEVAILEEVVPLDQVEVDQLVYHLLDRLRQAVQPQHLRVPHGGGK